MESILVFTIALAIIGGFGYATWSVYNSWRPNAKREEKTWQRFAKSEKLNFISGGDSGDTLVCGTHQGHFLMLRTSQTEAGIYTLISINRQKLSDDESEGDILNRWVDLTSLQQLRGQIQAEENGNRIYYKAAGVELNVDYIRSVFDLLHTLIAIYPKLIKLGGEVIPILHKVAQDSKEFRPLCIQMAREIGRETSHQLSEQISELWCPKCVTRFAAIEITLPEANKITYYGCRVCSQSREFLRVKNRVIAVLDNQELTEQIQHNSQLKVNWLSRREMFDFEEVEIVRATDEEVERFAVQVGNDTDEVRCHGYQEMVCTTTCELSANTIKILQSIFGEVKTEPISSDKL